jgi:flagellar M-ring protein FliF
MEQIRLLLDRLTLRQKITLGVGVIAALGLLSLLVQWNESRNYRPLFSNLSAEDAGRISGRLRESGVKFRLSENGEAVYVPSEKVAETRLSLAAEGLPKSGRIGYELFDKNNLAATDFQERVNFHRAIEGELERSVMSLGEVEAARVHVTFAKDSVFVESRQPAKASVLVTLRPGREMNPQSVSAIAHLAASAVEGLEPQAVSIMDTQGRLLSKPRRRPRPGEPEPDDAQLEFRGKFERELLAKVDATLEPLLGPEHFRASVSTEIDFSSGEHSEESFDPSRSVMASQQRSEDMSGAAAASGVPGAASNLPRPTSRPGETARNVSRRTENITYQSTRTVKRMLIPQGSVRRVSLSVVVDHDLKWEGSGAEAKRVLVAPAPEKLKKISDVLTAAAGLQPERGDQIIVESMPFDATLNALAPSGQAPADSPTPSSGFQWPSWVPEKLRTPLVFVAFAGLAVVGLAVAALLAFLRRRKAKRAAASSPPELAAAEPAKSLEEQMADHKKKKLELETATMSALKLSEPAVQKSELLQKQVTEVAKKDPAGIAQVIRTWLQEDSIAR